MELCRNSTRKNGVVIFSIELPLKDRGEEREVKKNDKTDKYS
jgi:hypothetical protein